MRLPRKRWWLLAGAAAAAVALVMMLARPESLESRVGRIREGMTRAEVEAALGAPPGNYLDRMRYFTPGTSAPGIGPTGGGTTGTSVSGSTPTTESPGCCSSPTPRPRPCSIASAPSSASDPPCHSDVLFPIRAFYFRPAFYRKALRDESRTMTNRNSFIRSIIAAPEDDAPRLIYADWLDEHGEPERADFIRTECRLARLPCTQATDPCSLSSGTMVSKSDCPNCLKARPLWWRRLELWKAHVRAMFREEISLGFTVSLGEERHPAGLVGTVHRGFVSAIAMTTRAFLDRAATLFAAYPITAVRLTDRHPESSPRGQVRWVDMSAGLARALAAGPPRRLAPGPDVPPQLFAAGLPRSPFASVAQANAALSVACVRHGRQIAGLPPLV
jgi:uncharacterized protein (TIGR02996 family)